MAEPMVRQLQAALLGGPNLRQLIFPVPAAAGTGLALGGAGNSPAWSAWADIALVAEILQESLVVALALDTPSAACIATIDIGTTLSLGVNYATAAAVTATAVAAIIAGAHRMEVRAELILVAAAPAPVIYLPYPIYVPAGVGIIARWQTQAGAQTANLTVMALQGWT